MKRMGLNELTWNDNDIDNDNGNGGISILCAALRFTTFAALHCRAGRCGYVFGYL